MEQEKLRMDLGECRKRAAEERGAMLFEDAAAGGRSSCFFAEPMEWIEIWTLEQVPAAFAAMERATAAGLWVAGYLGYECGYHWEPTAAAGFVPSGSMPLGVFGVYRAPVVPLRGGMEVRGCGLAEVELSLSPEEFAEKLSRAQTLIAAGDTYQVNLTCRVEAGYSEGADTLFAHMMQRQPVEFGAMLNLGKQVVLSASPELFFERRGREVRVRPMKGTSRRGRDATEDEQLAAELAADEKNRAENVMIVDLLRSDLGRIAEIGSVRVHDLFRVEQHPSLLQMTSTVEARLREDLSLYELFRALFPCGSIVGAPKVRTMQIIRELEGRDREVYTGAIGYLTPRRDAVFSVAIRTAVLQDGRVWMGVGAGITSGSKTAAEFEECQLKAEFLRDRSFELIESLRWEAGECALLERHVRRMKTSAKVFGFRFDEAMLRRVIAEQAAQLASDRVWKLRVTTDYNGMCFVSASEVANPSPRTPVVNLWAIPMQADDVWLQHKTTRRGLYDKAYEIAQKAGCVDAIFVNEHGMVTEGAIHNVLVKHGEIWRTPPRSAGVLPGVYREHLLAQRPEILEADICVEELLNADEVYVMNAVRGLRRVVVERRVLGGDSSRDADSLLE